MTNAYICDAIRTPIGRYGGSLSSIRADDLGAIPIKALMQRNPQLDFSKVDDLYYGCANQAGEDNRNVGRMSGLLAGLPETVPAMTINRLCGSGMDAVGSAARTIRSGEAGIIIAGGVESMSRAPFVMPKPNAAFSRKAEIYDTTMGWRFVNRAMKAQYGVDSMPETAENVAEEFGVNRQDQDTFALSSQQKTEAAQNTGVFDDEITAVSVPRRKQDPLIFDRDEHPRAGSTLEGMARLPTPFRENGSVTAGNASGINDGSAGMVIMSADKAKELGLNPLAKIKAVGRGACHPSVMGLSPVPAVNDLKEKSGLKTDDFELMEVNEAFAVQYIACEKELGLNREITNVNGSGIGLGHPVGATGARIIVTLIHAMQKRGNSLGLATLCGGGGVAMACAIEMI